MIKYIPHNLVDRDKYDLCIAQAKNARIFAFSWYLDAVAEKWGVLMSDSYSKVMPLPCRKKFGINYIYMPSWIQQLGVFSKDAISEDQVLGFLNSIPGKFVLVDYMLNASNPVNGDSFVKRTNYILPLNKGFDEIFKGYNKNRQRISKLNFKAFQIDKNGRGDEFLKLIKDEPMKYPISKNALATVNQLLMMDHPSIHTWIVYRNDACVGGLVWLKEKSRITYLLPVIKEEAKKEHLNTLLVNELIRDHQNADRVLDFEGSMIPGVARFYKSFGAMEETYHMYKKRLFSNV